MPTESGNSQQRQTIADEKKALCIGGSISESWDGEYSQDTGRETGGMERVSLRATVAGVIL